MEKKNKRIKIPTVVYAAISACICGFIYCANFRVFFDVLHWYSFSSDSNITIDEYNTIIGWMAVALFVYYTMFIVISVFVIVKAKKQIIISLIIMAALKLCTLALMLRPGVYMIFQLGFEAILEVSVFLCAAYILKNIGRNARLYESRITVCIIMVLAECIPFLRNCQFLFVDEINTSVKLSALFLPVLTALFICMLVIWTAGRRPALTDYTDETAN